MNPDTIGYLAAGLVFVTFCMRSMVPLRLVAIASNVAFIAYAYLGQLTPVLILHGLLMVVNGYHLLTVLHASGVWQQRAPACIARRYPRR